MPACVDELVEQSELVAKVAWGDEHAGVVGDSMEALGAARNRQDLAMLSAARSFECRGEHRAEGHVSVSSWLMHHLKLKRSAANRIARLGRFLSRHPVLEGGMAAGGISLDHVEALADHFQQDRAEEWEAMLPHFVEHAPHMRFPDVVRDLKAFANDLKPKTAEEKFIRQQAERSVTFTTTLDGMGFGRLWLEPFAAAAFQEELDRRYRELVDEDRARAKEILGHEPDAIELLQLTRSPQQRRHDAFMRIVERSKAFGGGKTAASYAVVLHTTLDAYEAALEHLATGVDLVVPPGGFCETAAGEPISPVAAVYASLRGHVRRIVFDADDEIISFGRGRRLFSDAQADAGEAKFRRCTHPFGCDCTGSILQADHDIEWEDGGRTDVGNLRPKDGSHNRWKTNTKHDPPPDGHRDDGQRRGPPRWW